MRTCPNCGKLLDLNPYFGSYICDDCDWEDNSFFLERVNFFSCERISYIDNEEIISAIINEERTSFPLLKMREKK